MSKFNPYEAWWLYNGHEIVLYIGQEMMLFYFLNMTCSSNVKLSKNWHNERAWHFVVCKNYVTNGLNICYPIISTHGSSILTFFAHSIPDITQPTYHLYNRFCNVMDVSQLVSLLIFPSC